MDSQPGRLVKAVYDFPTEDEEELPLRVGDIIQVKERIDKQWSKGVCAGRKGNFPIGFTIDIKIPELAENQRLFAVTDDFIAQENGDLTIKRGELVVGIKPIDSNWWNGEKDGVNGIFPINYVWEVNKNILPVSNTNNKMFKRAKVKMSMKAQLAEEMDLHENEIVNVIEEVEKGWYRGECNGRRGIFPAAFVSILPDSAAESSTSLSNGKTQTEIFETPIYENKYGYDCINSGITAYGRALYPFQAESSNELSLKGGEIVNLIKYVDENWIEGEIDGKTGIFPANFINVIVDCPKPAKLCESESTCGSDVTVFPSDTYGRVISDFQPEYEGDVRLKEGDTVTLIRQLDNNWYEVETDDGDCGICPKSYIEVIGSGPPSYSEVMSSVSGYHSSSFTDFDSSTSDHTMNNSKSSRPLSFTSSASDSSFSSQSSANDKSSSKGVTKLLDDKVSENLAGLDTSLFNSETALNKSSNSYYNVGGNMSQENNILNSTFDSSPRSFSSSSPAFTPKSGNITNLNNSTPIPSIVKTPPRPPPPSNIILSQNNICNNSFNSRQSIGSVSSHGSSDTSFDYLDEKEIQSQIQMREQTLKQRASCINKLETELKNTSNSSVSSEIRTQISQLNDDIERLKREIESLQAKQKTMLSCTVLDQNSIDESRLRDEEVARKRELENKRRDQAKINKLKEQRDCIITELLQTEKDYVADLKLLYQTFFSDVTEAQNKGVNIMVIFGNLDEVIAVADQLLKRLQKIARENQLIGQCFLDMSDEMKEVYGHYCRNHDEANSVLVKIEPQSVAGQYINHKLDILKRQTNCFDLGAMLIKPVQRILKYPLLLDQLLKCTDDSHPDKPCLEQAITRMTDVATAINEFKRQKDVVFKYLKPGEKSFSGRISKLNLHTLAKKSSRFGMRLSTIIGLDNVIADEEFDKIVKKFHCLEKHLNIFLKDLTDYTKKAEELYTCTFSLAEGIAELYQERKSQQEVEQFRAAHRVILTEYWESFKQTVDRSIHSPVKQLLHAYSGPKNLILKRQDKLFDYLLSAKRLEKNKDVTRVKMLQEAQVMAKNNYEALNSELLTDLPKLYDLSVEILCDCIRCFLRAKKNFIGKTARHMFELMNLPLMLGSQGAGILETFHVKHTLVMDDLSRLSIAFKQLQSCIKPSDTLKKNSPKGNRLSFGNIASSGKFQTPNQKDKIKSSYPSSDLYNACENFDAVDIMDISLKKGDIVAVIKQQDPMGNKMRWFVDRGDARGFVPAKCLMKFLPDASSFTNAWNTSDVTTTISSTAVDLQNLHKPKSVSPQAPIKQKPQPQSNVASQSQAQNISSLSQKQNFNPQTQIQNVAPQSQSINKQNILYQPQAQVRQNISAQPRQSVMPQNQTQTRQKNVIQPARPAPPVTSSLRTVAPSRYPPVSHSATSKSKENNPLLNLPRIVVPNTIQSTNSQSNVTSNILQNINSNTNALNTEPVHRYEEIPESANSGQNSHSSSTSKNNPSNILDEFDPYSSSKGTEMYDNVPDNMNSIYNAHRYEDIPEDSYYEEVPTEAEASSSDEYYYALYDFTPTGPNQLSLRKGQVVLVLHKCDLNQNSEWWFVEDRHGNKGYVPAAYLNKYSKDVA